jgi:CRISPR-associated protein Cmr5
MNKIDKLLKVADDALNEFNLVQNNKVTEEVYDGYLASFGATVIISGLIQTVAVYEANDERRKVLNAITTVAGINHGNQQIVRGNHLLQLCLDNHSNKTQINLWREKVLDASVALKMMIRTYQFENN